MNDIKVLHLYLEDRRRGCLPETDKAIKEALLALENKNVLETELKLVRKQMLDYENKLNRLEKWLEREIKVSTEVTENRCKEIITKAISRKRLDTLKEVHEVLE